MSGIANCPWCGGITTTDDDLAMRKFVQCENDDCLSAGPSCSTESEAIAAWNRVAAVGDVVAALARVIPILRNLDTIRHISPDFPALDDALVALAAARGETP